MSITLYSYFISFPGSGGGNDDDEDYDGDDDEDDEDDAPDLPDESVEHVVHVSAVRGARLVEGTRELLCERLALGGLHGPHGLLEVDLVGHEDDGDVLRGPHLRDQAPVLHGLVETVSVKIPSVTRGSSIKGK